MTLLKAESWIGVGATQTNRKWSQVGANPTVQTGRWGSGSRAMQTGNTGWGYAVANLTTTIQGAAFKNTGGFNTLCLFWGWDSATAQWCLINNTSGNLVAKRGGNTGTTLGTSSLAMLTNQSYYIECKVTVHDSTGVFVVKVNGDTWLNLTSQDTQNTANTFVNQIGFGADPATQTGMQQHVEDMYICDTAGSSPTNDFLGDVRVQGLLPDANGNTSNLVGQDANSTDNYLNVDEDAPGADDDTTYNESSTVNDKDTYNYPALTPTTGTVYGVQISPLARKTDAGVRSIASIARLSGTEVDSSNKALSATYIYLPDVRETKPGGGAWSISDVNSAEFGVKVTA